MSRSPRQESPKRKSPKKESSAALRERVGNICRVLDQHYPEPECALIHNSPFQLLIATILSAQCTDAMVNKVTPALFARFPDAAALAESDQEEVEQLIKSTGFYRNKAKNIRGAAQVLVTNFGGEVPRSMNELLTVPGAARKTANVVLGTAYGIASGVVVDTHVTRIAGQLGLTSSTNAVKIEQDLVKLLPKERWISFSHQLILHGRAICIARRPRCGECPLAGFCPGSQAPPLNLSQE